MFVALLLLLLLESPQWLRLAMSLVFLVSKRKKKKEPNQKKETPQREITRKSVTFGVKSQFHSHKRSLVFACFTGGRRRRCLRGRRDDRQGRFWFLVKVFPPQSQEAIRQPLAPAHFIFFSDFPCAQTRNTDAFDRTNLLQQLQDFLVFVFAAEFGANLPHDSVMSRVLRNLLHA
jgi:hypothetical protein